MLHVDTGEAGVYEFGTVEGADGPVVVNGVVATFDVPLVDSIIASPQIIVHADNYEMMEGMMMEEMAPTFKADAVLSTENGFLVIHQDSGEGSPGPVAGYTPVTAGLNLDVAVELDPAMLTPVVFPMLHVDTGEAGVYEFGTVEGADGPVRVNDQVVTFPVNIAPSYNASEPQSLAEGTVTLDWVHADAIGWLVIHSSVDGGPGPVAGVAPVNFGINRNVVVNVDLSGIEGAATDQVFPMLHYDNAAIGSYEFGSVEGADGPVIVGGNVVVGPLAIE
jgi:hypothetical protein